MEVRKKRASDAFGSAFTSHTVLPSKSKTLHNTSLISVKPLECLLRSFVESMFTSRGNPQLKTAPVANNVFDPQHGQFTL